MHSYLQMMQASLSPIKIILFRISLKNNWKWKQKRYWLVHDAVFECVCKPISPVVLEKHSFSCGWCPLLGLWRAIWKMPMLLNKSLPQSPWRIINYIHKQQANCLLDYLVSVLIPDGVDSKSPLIVPGLIAAEWRIAVLLLALMSAWSSLPNTHELLLASMEAAGLKLIQ